MSKVSTLKGVIDQFIFDSVKHVGNIKCFHSVEYFENIVAFELGIRSQELRNRKFISLSLLLQEVIQCYIAQIVGCKRRFVR